ncbi:unnamed protein product [Periconia digitata]|uniref:Uncharacterized protein n=1 Tax=Periconia digitata TaxID=1303443 RepID=A0A9W4UDM2_9PLEO|nr:unnamed protein product [Periconia digitata]
MKRTLKPSASNPTLCHNSKIGEGAQDVNVSSGHGQHQRTDNHATQDSPIRGSSQSQATHHHSQSKLPSYLNGKNPYGRILDQIDHPYREPQQISTSPPSQLGSSIEGRPRTSGAFHFKTRPDQVTQPVLDDIKHSPPPPSSQPFPRPIQKQSFNTTRNFFENKVDSPSQASVRAPVKPTRTGTFRAGKDFFESKSRESEKALSPLKGNKPSQRSDEFVKAKRDAAAPKLAVTALDDSPAGDPSLARRRSTNVFTQSRRGPHFLGRKHCHEAHHSKVKDESHTPKEPAVSPSLHSQETKDESVGYDGSSAHHSYSYIPNQRTPVPDMVFTNSADLQDSYYSIEVPDDIDDRGGYGRRKSQDFGYPSARIRPGSTLKTYRTPLQDPGRWTKRSCGHFSSIGAMESHEDATSKPCSQCTIKKNAALSTLANKLVLTPFPRPPIKEQGAYSISSSSDTDTFVTPEEQPPSPHPGYHQSQADRSFHAPDRYAEDFVQDVSRLLDSILEEHQNTLQKVINNIESSRQQRRPYLAPSRGVTEGSKIPLVTRLRQKSWDPDLHQWGSRHGLFFSMPTQHIRQAQPHNNTILSMHRSRVHVLNPPHGSLGKGNPVKLTQYRHHDFPINPMSLQPSFQTIMIKTRLHCHQTQSHRLHPLSPPPLLLPSRKQLHSNSNISSKDTHLHRRPLPHLPTTTPPTNNVIQIPKALLTTPSPLLSLFLLHLHYPHRHHRHILLLLFLLEQSQTSSP